MAMSKITNQPRVEDSIQKMMSEKQQLESQEFRKKIDQFRNEVAKAKQAFLSTYWQQQVDKLLVR